MALTAAMVTALAAGAARAFVAVKIVLPSATIRLIDGSGSVTFNAETYTGLDATYGSLGGIEAVREESGFEAPRMRLTLLPPTTSAAAALLAEANQDAPVTVYFGCVTTSTGAVVADPELIFLGLYDVPKLAGGPNKMSVEVDVGSQWERFFAAEEGARLNTAWHQSIWTGELGLDFVIDSLTDPFWGVVAPKDPIVTGSGGQYSDDVIAGTASLGGGV